MYMYVLLHFAIFAERETSGECLVLRLDISNYYLIIKFEWYKR